MFDRILVVTPARNEAHQIHQTIESVLAQTFLPWRYYLVSDGSDDGTDVIMQEYASKYDFINYIRREKPSEENKRIEVVTPGKVGAINLALQSVSDIGWDYLAILDADIVLPDNFYHRLMDEFKNDVKLGLAGGFLRSILPDGAIAPGGFINPDAVGGPVQTFRRQCYEDIGGYKSYGHEDCLANSDAREEGWTVRSFPDIQGDHHVPYEGYAPTVRYKAPALYKLGKMDYVMYVPFWFVILQSTARCFSRPFLVAGFARFGGYMVALVQRPTRTPPQENWLSRQESYLTTVLAKLVRVVRRVVRRT